MFELQCGQLKEVDSSVCMKGFQILNGMQLFGRAFRATRREIWVSLKVLAVVLDRLEHSSMFHLSLGSKELFHSNFLYWLSIVDWNAFMQVVRKLAGVERFWREEQYKRSDNRDENEIEVRRESRNFDLSIHIRIEQERDEEDSSRAKGILLDYKYYGKSFIYQNVLIPESVTIEHVLQAMVKDAQKCLKI